MEAIIEIINENLNKLNSSFKKTASSSPKKRKLTSRRSFKKTASSSTKRIKIRTI
jgi:hypothetical protein